MATTTAELPERRTGRPALYPWAEWLNGEVWILKHGEDFNPPPGNFRNMILYQGRERGVKIETRVEGDYVYVQRV